MESPPCPHQPTGGSTWRVERRVEGDTTFFDAYEGAQFMYSFRKEHNALGLVDSANRTGYPDVSFCVDDEKGP